MPTNVKHTPGPWKSVGGDYFIQASREYGVNPATQHDLDICHLAFENNMYAGERQANAQLIVAAPDMKDALVTAEYELVTLIPRLTQPYRKNAETVVEKIRAAIRKSELRP